jgi:lambda family phage portal protein
VNKPRYRGPAATATPVDIGASAMQPLTRFADKAFQASSLSHPDLGRWQPYPGSPDSDLLPEQATIRSRSRDLARNNGVAGSALQTQLDNVLGCGLWLAPTPDYTLLKLDRKWASAWRRPVKALWRNWFETNWCDAGRSLTGDALATQVFSGAFLNGDGVALPLWLPEAMAPLSTRLQVIESDRLCNPNFASDSARLRGGVEIDQYGAPVAYHIRKSHPGDTMLYASGAEFTWERIPATTAWGRRRMIHAHNKDRAGQSRGIPALAGVMRQFKVLGDFQNAQLKSAVVNAMVGLVVESALSQEGLLELLSNNSDALTRYTEGLAGRQRAAVDFSGGGMILPIPLGDKVSGFTPGRPSTADEAFLHTAFTYIAAGLNMPVQLLTKDFSKMNYSSARVALMEGMRFFGGRRNWLALGFYQPCYELFMEEMVEAGEIEAPGFYENKTAWCRARWIGPGRGWVDQMKEAQAAELRMSIFISSLEDECAEQGKDWEELLEQIAEENARLKELNLTRARVGKSLQTKAPADTGGDAPEEVPEEEEVPA